MRVVIFGTGGAGGYFGAQLARAGEDVIFIARGQHLNAIRMHGLCIETPAGEIAIRPAQATDDPAQISNVDVVLVGVKAWQVTCPPSRSVSAGPAPRYGTWAMSTPVIILNSSPATWDAVPLEMPC
jgi:hypothetical protein